MKRIAVAYAFSLGHAPQELLEPLAELVVCGETLVDLTGLLATLNDIGARTVLCEGGPHLNHQLFAAGLVDELCVSISPMLVGGVGLGGRGLLELNSASPLIPRARTRLGLETVVLAARFLAVEEVVRQKISESLPHVDDGRGRNRRRATPRRNHDDDLAAAGETASMV